MFSKYHLGLKYLYYLFKASNAKGHGMHSPFIFDFIKNVLNDKTEYPSYGKIEAVRKNMLNDPTELTVEDLGAGSVDSKHPVRTVTSITRHAVKQRKYGQLLHRLVIHYKPRNILELGTSLGITTSYLAAAKPDSRVITLEGSMEVADVANRNFEKLDLKNIELVRGNFDEKLSPVLTTLSSVDLAFIDGNHRLEPTQRYFEQLLPKLNNDSILVFDDIHWSREMEKAWEHIFNHSSVTCSVDLFSIGIIFFRKEFKQRQNFIIRF